ncbi:MAG: hypothetical protein ACK4NQ_11990 [Fimbriimonadaceae bacterium]
MLPLVTLLAVVLGLWGALKPDYDAVAAAGGVAPNGSTMRVYLARRTESGRVEVVEYRLDAFLKDGNMEQNPIVQEGDVVVVGEPKGLTAGAAIQVISAASILRTIFGN